MKLETIDAQLDAMPLIAILRGIKPCEVLEIGQVLIDAGVRVIEVPLNSPDPLESIRLLVENLGDKAWIGAGTVLSPADVRAVKKVGGDLIVSPNADVDVVKETVASEMASFPGILTPTEAFAVVKAGAKNIKIFPAGANGPSFIKDVKSVLPKEIRVCAVGGANAENANVWFENGADGLGIGSGIYKAGDSAETVKAKAEELVSVITVLKSRN